MTDRHAVYATTPDHVCFRIGEPTDWHNAQDRWARLDNNAAPGRVRHERRSYPVKFYEVRTVDKHGRGLGSERHATALLKPYRAHRKAGR